MFNAQRQTCTYLYCCLRRDSVGITQVWMKHPTNHQLLMLLSPILVFERVHSDFELLLVKPQKLLHTGCFMWSLSYLSDRASARTGWLYCLWTSHAVDINETPALICTWTQRYTHALTTYPGVPGRLPSLTLADSTVSLTLMWWSSMRLLHWNVEYIYVRRACINNAHDNLKMSNFKHPSLVRIDEWSIARSDRTCAR